MHAATVFSGGQFTSMCHNYDGIAPASGSYKRGCLVTTSQMNPNTQISGHEREKFETVT